MNIPLNVLGPVFCLTLILSHVYLAAWVEWRGAHGRTPRTGWNIM